MLSRKRNEWWRQERKPRRRTQLSGALPTTPRPGRRASIPMDELMETRVRENARPAETESDHELLGGLLKMAGQLERHRRNQR